MSLSSAFVFILPFICEGLGALIQTTVGADVEFPLSEECRKGEGTLYQRLDDASTQLIASLNGYWKPGRDYTVRVIVGRDSLILTNANFNDNGHYEFTCNKKYLEAYKLEVFLPSEVVVSEGGDAILPCRAATAGQSVKSARWRRNGEVLLELNAPRGEIIYGEDLNRSRVSIPSDWDRRADLSLTIKGVQQQDGGVYYCAIEKAEKHRSAVRLRVRKPPESSNWTWITIIITAAVISVIVFTLVFFWSWRGKTKSVHA